MWSSNEAMAMQAKAAYEEFATYVTDGNTMGAIRVADANPDLFRVIPAGDEVLVDITYPALFVQACA